jgi:hypothetical protein
MNNKYKNIENYGLIAYFSVGIDGKIYLASRSATHFRSH